MQAEAHARGVARVHCIHPSIQQRHELLEQTRQFTAAWLGMDQSSKILDDSTQFAREAYTLLARLAPPTPQHSRSEAIRACSDSVQSFSTTQRQTINSLNNRDGRQIDPSRRGILRIRQLLNRADIGDDDTRDEPA